MHNNIELSANRISGDHMSAIAFDARSANRIRILNNTIAGRFSGAVKAIDCNDIVIQSNIVKLVNSSIAIDNEGGSRWRISGNELLNTAEKMNPASGQINIGIRNYWRSAVFNNSENTVSDNKISGFTASVLEDSWGNMSASSNRYYGNVLESFYDNLRKKSDARIGERNEIRRSSGKRYDQSKIIKMQNGSSFKNYK
ncbi:hypothetical protein GCM10023143_32800 [Compostibacter hankyongensis]|uniref:Periplasmic copper-binding protein NosD beta helix domain-containing protein n=1 Tax=Compostibacter hankyongensis TaxID=1007089 RepID=A0ABP8G860_9BACT